MNTDADFMNPNIFYWRGVDRFVFPEHIHYMERQNLVADPQNGGLVLGPSHDDGGIQIFCKHGDEYKWIGEMEGYEYLVSTYSTHKYHEKIKAVNDSQLGYHPFFEPYEVPYRIATIDCNPVKVGGESVTKWIDFSGLDLWIVNKIVTQKHLHWLNEINQEKQDRNTWSKIKSWLSFKL